jgi:Iron only hydrogenase large subunit, C-terminal domain.
MTAISKYIKKHDPMAMTVFIGPCTAKKSEVMREDIKGITDFAMTFEEMAAILDAAKIDIKEQQDVEVDDATLFGRKFARSGGVLEAVIEAIKEIDADTEINPIICNGLEECNKTLKIMKAGKLPNNFVEGMACVGGCIGGAGVINNNVNQAKLAVNKFGDASLYKNIKERVNQLDADEVDFHIGHSSDESNKTSCKEA